MAATELLKTVLINNTNLKAYYRFESGALTTDSSGNGKTLTNNGSVSDGAGVFGGAADFGASNTTKYLRIADALTIDGGAMTFSCWVKLNTEIGAGLYDFMSTYNSNNKVVYNLRYNYNSGTRKLSFIRGKAGVGDQQVDYTVTLGTSNWYHLVMTYDATNIRGYVNGAFVGSAAANGNGTYADTSASSVGSQYEGSSKSSALIDEAQFWNTALSPDQIKELYEGRTIGELWPQSGLVGLWHLNGHSTDFSGNNNHGTDTSVTYSMANGKFNQGAGFNGSTSKIDCGTGSSLERTGAQTWALWFKLTAKEDTLFAVKDGTGARYLYYDSATDQVQFAMVGLTPNNVTSSGLSLTTGVWYYLVGVYTGSALKVYLNAREFSASTTGSVTACTGSFAIGAKDGRSINGAIDEVAIFNVAKDANWVRQQYHLGLKKFRAPTE